MAKFVPRQRKHKVLARQKAAVETKDTNVEVILPSERKEVEEKKVLLREELKGGVKVSSKKAKRLEKYIENKLKKDENRELLQKLAESKIDTTLFASSRNLGQAKQTRRQARREALLQRRAGIGGEESTDEEDEGQSRGESDDEYASGSEKSAAPSAQAPAPDHRASLPSHQPLLAGSGLKRPLELDEYGKPVLQKRQKRGGIKSKFNLQTAQPQPQVAEFEEWGGFSEGSQSDSGSKLESSAESSLEDESESTSGEDDSESGGDEEDEDDEADGETNTKRTSAFKAWAQQQRNAALGYEPAEPLSALPDIPRPKNFTARPIEQDPLPRELQPTTTNINRKAYSVTVNRSPEVQTARLALPIIGEEQRIMEAIHNHDIVVISGATGSGKTTQVPQFLFEAGYGSVGSPTPGMIGITQPRRVAAVSMSKRVAQELGDHSHVVAYQIRFEGSATQKTAVKFMTDGVLLREVAGDISLRKYSAIIVDEAHERSVNTDVLVGILSRANKVRSGLSGGDSSLKPLKLIIMSATLRVEDMTENTVLFPTPPPVISVEGRQYPVTTHFSRRTRHDYVEEAFQKISRGHRKLPPGGFLVFLTGQNEIHQLSRRLKLAFSGVASAAGPKVRIPASEAPFEAEDVDFGDIESGADVDDEESGDEDEEKEFEIEDEDPGTGPLRMNILPLYSLLPTREQQKVFEPPPDGYRQVILATNVAETSLTIPGIRYVFDCGRSKERRYNRHTGVQSFEIGWISKASANQRSGRAGRTGPGHCYRLYSSAVYERDFAEFAEPELLRMPIEGVVLQLRAMHVPNVAKFPFPTPPDRQSLVRADKILKYLSAITPDGRVTDIGSLMSFFPLSPRFAKILLVGHIQDCMPYTIAMVAGLSAGEIFVARSRAIPAVEESEPGTFRTQEDIRAEDERARITRAYDKVHQSFCSLDDKSDAVKLLQVVGEFAHDPTEEWCQGHFVSYKALSETIKLRRQIADLLRYHVTAFAHLAIGDKLERPSEKQVGLLKQIVAAGFVDQVAIRADKAPNPPEMHRNPTRAIDVPYLPLTPLQTGAQGDDSDKLVYIHPSSPLAHLSKSECPEYIIYAHLQTGTPGGAAGEKRPKTRMHALTDVTGTQLASLAKGTPLISYGKPIKEIQGNANSRECWVIPYLRAEGTGGMGWPLPVKKVKQTKVPGKGWVVT